MLIPIDEFRHRVDDDRATLVSDLQELTGRYGSDEAAAWDNSLLALSRVTRAPSFGPLHLFFGRRGHLSLEYQLPASSSWCDVVLLGAHNRAPAAVFLELKDWTTRGDQPGRYEGLIERQGEQRLHPSDQVRGYAEYCRQFHSAVADHEAAVHGGSRAIETPGSAIERQREIVKAGCRLIGWIRAQRPSPDMRNGPLRRHLP